MTSAQAQLSSTFIPVERRTIERRRYVGMSYGALLCGVLVWTGTGDWLPMSGLIVFSLAISFGAAVRKFDQFPQDSVELRRLKANIVRNHPRTSIVARVGTVLAWSAAVVRLSLMLLVVLIALVG